MSKQYPRISVVMPVFNAEDYIHRAIESILNQTFKDFEFIIVNDASKDKSLQIIRSYARKDNRIRLVNNTHNLKIALTLNKGVSFARADLIARMDADDVSHPSRLEAQYLYLQKNPKVAIVGTNISIVDQDGKGVWKREYPARSNDLKKVIFRYSPFAHPSVLFRKSVFNEFGGYNPVMVPCEDIDLWFKIGSKYDFGNIPKRLLKYTLSTSSGNRYDLRKTELLGFKIKITAIKNLGYKPNLYDLVYNVLQFLSLWIMPAKARLKLYNTLRSGGFI